MKDNFTIFASAFGVLAQLVERLNGIQKVRSSILLCSTEKTDNQCSYRDYTQFVHSFYELCIISFIIPCHTQNALKDAFNAWQSTPSSTYDFSLGRDKIVVRYSSSEYRTHGFTLDQLRPAVHSHILIAYAVLRVAESGTLGLSLKDLYARVCQRVPVADSRLRLHTVTAHGVGRDSAQFEQDPSTIPRLYGRQTGRRHLWSGFFRSLYHQRHARRCSVRTASLTPGGGPGIQDGRCS